MSKLLTLLSGTAVTAGLHGVVLPEVLDDVAVGDTVTVENEKGEFLCVAEVHDVAVETFALLQKKHFQHNAHPQFGSWPNAYEAMRQLVPGFSQSDKVTVVVFEPLVVSTAGLTVTKSDEQEDKKPEPTPSEDEMFASLEEEGANV